MSSRAGLFVVLEGGEGSGKSTAARELAERLRKDGHAVTVTEEPTGTALGRHIWTYFQTASHPVDPLAELLLFEAARAQHVQSVIRPALQRGEVVVCDRFTLSSVAYQGYGRGLDIELVARMNEAATGGLEPDVTLLLDVPVEVGLARAASAHGKDRDAIGDESREFHERVREGFLTLARRRRMPVIDTSRPREEVAEEALSIVRASLAAAKI